MELEKRYIHKNEIKARTYYQSNLDDDYNLADYKPDIMKIIKYQGKIITDEVRVSNQCIFITGRLQFQILYLGESGSSSISSLTGEIPMREKINMDQIEELDPVEVTAKVNDMNITVINSRKINIRAIVDFHALAYQMTDEQIPVHLENEEQYQILRSEREALQLIENKKDIVRIRQEFMLPQDKPNATELLWSTASIQGIHTNLQEHEMQVSADADVCILYKSTEETPFEWMEITIPVQGSMECSMGKNGEHYQTRIINLNTQMELREDDDGESRNVALDIYMEIELSIWKEERINMIEDLYALDKEIHIQRKNIYLQQLLQKNDARIKVAGELPLDELEPAIYLCGAEGTVSIDDTQLLEDALQVTGRLLVEVLYLTSDDVIPLSSAKKSFPIEARLETGPIHSQDRISLESSVEQLRVSLEDPQTASVKGEIQLNLMVFSQEETPVIEEIQLEESNEEQLQKRPGMTGYLVGREDTLWQIAREYNTTVADLMEINQLTEEVLRPGQKLLIVKRVAG